MVYGAAQPEDSKALASLHKKGIPTGFLSSLDIRLLESLYLHLIKNEIVIVAKEGDMVTGFISASLNLKSLYLKFIARNIFGIASKILSLSLSATFFRKVLETLKIPFRKSAGHLNQERIPELLSIVIDDNSRGKGIGGDLLLHLESRLRIDNCNKYRVVVGDQLKQAMKFYLNSGFKEMETNEFHKGEISHILIKEISA